MSSKLTVLEVAHTPGAASPAHSHPRPVIAYVVSGDPLSGKWRARSRLPGESFFEPANGVHLISANASRTEPAKFGVYLALAIQIYVLLEVDFAGNGAIPLDEFEAQLHKLRFGAGFSAY